MKNSFLKFFLLVALVEFIEACSCGCASNNSIPTYQKIAAVKFGVNYSVIFNKDSSYVLCTNKGGVPGSLHPSALRFFVFDLRKGKILLEDTFPSAKVKWAGNYKLLVINFPEAFSKRKGENLIKIIYDLKRGTKTEIKK